MKYLQEANNSCIIGFSNYNTFAATIKITADKVKNIENGTRFKKIYISGV